MRHIVHSILLMYESITHLISLALLLQCTHQLSPKIVEVSTTTRLRLRLLLIAPSIERVVGLCLLLLVLLVSLALMSLLVEGKAILMLIRLVTAMVGTIAIVLLLGAVLLVCLVGVVIVSAPLLLLSIVTVTVASHTSHGLLVVSPSVCVVSSLLLLHPMTILLSLLNRWRVPALGWVWGRRRESWRRWLPTLNGWDLRWWH
mmetsp:Transcript_12249/g.21217  ORF Transcript_12249/g.21217 Transcript_12249/m.21217 type:complete len:202 (+) Transcript_12249:201-806(+)